MPYLYYLIAFAACCFLIAWLCRPSKDEFGTGPLPVPSMTSARDELIALLESTIRALLELRTTELLAKALLKKEPKPFLQYIASLQAPFEAYLTDLIGTEGMRRKEEGVPFRLADEDHHEPLNIALSVSKDSLGDLTKVSDGELRTYPHSIHLIGLVEAWGRMQAVYAQPERQAKKAPKPSSLELSPEAERMIELVSRMNVSEACIAEHAKDFAGELEERLCDGRVSPPDRGRLEEGVRNLRVAYGRVSTIPHDCALSETRHGEAKEAVSQAYLDSGLIVSRSMELHAAWVLLYATFEIQRKLEAFRTGKSAFNPA